MCKLCLVWTRPSSADISTLSRLVRLYTCTVHSTHVMYIEPVLCQVRLTELLHQTPVVSTQVSLDISSPGPALDKIEAWLLTTL